MPLTLGKETGQGTKHGNPRSLESSCSKQARYKARKLHFCAAFVSSNKMPQMYVLGSFEHIAFCSIVVLLFLRSFESLYELNFDMMYFDKLYLPVHILNLDFVEYCYCFDLVLTKHNTSLFLHKYVCPRFWLIFSCAVWQFSYV